MITPKLVTIDVETAPLESYTWGLWEQNVGLEMIKTEWSILAFCAKTFGKKDVIYADTSGRGAGKVRDDSKLLKQLWTILDDADIVIGQNVRRFDIKKINARMALAGMPPYSPVRVIDTLEAAKRTFAFTSNKLAWTSKYLTDTPKSEHKKFPGFELWKACLDDDPKAWAEMKKYNIRDVIATEQLYLKLRPWMPHPLNLGVYTGDKEHHRCPACGSKNTQRRGRATTQAFQYWRYQCQECGSWSRERLRIKE
jgi:predicted RNA-binding Zn-ribbon protein involved in translation (DUF1610 family)